jgi:hypothetical protein
MTWLDPTTDERGYAERLARDEPDLYRLALALAPALRIEPLLLRNARLRFVPDSDAGLEAELWFSALIASRSARACVLRPGLARLLCDRLERPDAPLPAADVHRFVRRHTAHWPALERLEQEMRQRARRGDREALISGLRQVLSHIDREPSEAERRELARWVKGLLPVVAAPEPPRDPERGHSTPAEVGLLAQYAAASLGDVSGGLSARAASPGLPSWLADRMPGGATHAIGLILRPGVLECMAAGQGDHTLELAGAPPAAVHLQPADAT